MVHNVLDQSLFLMPKGIKCEYYNIESEMCRFFSKTTRARCINAQNTPQWKKPCTDSSDSNLNMKYLIQDNSKLQQTFQAFTEIAIFAMELANWHHGKPN